jgi:hypothetical protein
VEIHGHHTRETHEDAIRKVISEALMVFGQRVSGSTQFGSWVWTNKLTILPSQIKIDVRRDGAVYLATVTVLETIEPANIPEF